MSNVVVKSDGTTHGTRILVGGVEIKYVTKIEIAPIDADGDDLVQAIVTISKCSLDLAIAGIGFDVPDPHTAEVLKAALLIDKSKAELAAQKRILANSTYGKQPIPTVKGEWPFGNKDDVTYFKGRWELDPVDGPFRIVTDIMEDLVTIPDELHEYKLVLCKDEYAHDDIQYNYRWDQCPQKVEGSRP